LDHLALQTFSGERAAHRLPIGLTMPADCPDHLPTDCDWAMANAGALSQARRLQTTERGCLRPIASPDYWAAAVFAEAQQLRPGFLMQGGKWKCFF